MVALDVCAELPEVLEQAFLDRLEPGLTRVAGGIDAAELDQVVLELVQDQGVDVALGLLPVGFLAGLECDQLEREAGSLGPSEGSGSSVRQLLLLAPGERVLELVVGNLLELRVVALGDELEVGLAFLFPP